MQNQKEVPAKFHLIYICLLIFVKILLFVLILTAIAQTCRTAYKFGYAMFGSVSVKEIPDKEVNFGVSKSDGMFDIASKLEEEELIPDKYSFYLHAVVVQPDHKLKAGRYFLSNAMDYEQIINKITVSD